MSDNHEPTPWEEINPPMASVQRLAPPCEFSAQDDARKVFRNELTACLALVAPAGMTEEARGEWLMVAWDSLGHIPPSILRDAARTARLQCDHPAKIVPAIVAAAEEPMRFRSRMTEWDRATAPRLTGPKPTYCSPSEAREILEGLGLKSQFPSQRD